MNGHADRYATFGCEPIPTIDGDELEVKLGRGEAPSSDNLEWRRQ
jgi:hypothetical protein